jgi:non-heme chloroperoxidase
MIRRDFILLAGAATFGHSRAVQALTRESRALGMPSRKDRTVVMVHGAFAGGWCFERFHAVFESRGWTCYTPDLLGHGVRTVESSSLANLGVQDYRAALETELRSFATPPILLGHSLGAVLVQQLAARGLARALILVSPAPRSGILPTAESEKRAAQGLMTLGPFWTTVVYPNFDVAVQDSLSRVPQAKQHEVFDRFGPESGRALFELFFWMLDTEAATAVDVGAIRCPVLCVSGTEDRVVSLATARATAAGLGSALLWEESEHGHMLPVEPGADEVARRMAEWAEIAVN